MNEVLAEAAALAVEVNEKRQCGVEEYAQFCSRFARVAAVWHALREATEIRAADCRSAAAPVSAPAAAAAAPDGRTAEHLALSAPVRSGLLRLIFEYADPPPLDAPPPVASVHAVAAALRASFSRAPPAPPATPPQPPQPPLPPACESVPAADAGLSPEAARDFAAIVASLAAALCAATPAFLAAELYSDLRDSVLQCAEALPSPRGGGTGGGVRGLFQAPVDGGVVRLAAAFSGAVRLAIDAYAVVAGGDTGGLVPKGEDWLVEDAHCASDFAVSVESLLAACAYIRSREHVLQDPSLVVEGYVIRSDAVQEEATSVAAGLAQQLLAEDVTLPLASACRISDRNPSFISPFHSLVRRFKQHVGTGLTSTSVAEAQVLYMQAYSFFASQQCADALAAVDPWYEIRRFSAKKVRSVQPEWQRLMWEASQSRQLLVVLELLAKEAFAAPFDCALPPGDADEEVDLPPPEAWRRAHEASTVVERYHSVFAAEAHSFLVELREDAAAAFSRKPPLKQPCSDGTSGGSNRAGEAFLQSHFRADVTGQWRAARDIVAAVFYFSALLLNRLVNAFHNRVERFGYGERNMLPFLIATSDVLSIAVVHFDCPTVGLLIGRPFHAAERQRSDAGPVPPPRMSVKLLAEVAGCSAATDFPGNAPHLLAKLALLVGLAVDRIRGDIGLVTHETSGLYCAAEDPSLASGRKKKKKGTHRSSEGDGVSGDGDREWRHSWTETFEELLSTLVYPLGNLCKRIAPELALEVLSHMVSSIVEDFVTAVRKHCCAGRSSVVPPSALSTWGSASQLSPSALAAMHPVLATLFADLQRLTAYLCTHLNDFPLLDLPCWLLPSSLVYLLGDAKR